MNDCTDCRHGDRIGQFYDTPATYYCYKLEKHLQPSRLLYDECPEYKSESGVVMYEELSEREYHDTLQSRVTADQMSKGGLY